MIMKTNIIIGPKMGASPNTCNTNLESGTITGGRALKQLQSSLPLTIRGIKRGWHNKNEGNHHYLI